MAKRTLASEVASAVGAAAARVENLKPRRTTTVKSAKKGAINEDPVAVETPAEEPTLSTTETVIAATPVVPTVADLKHEEIALLAYEYWEKRGHQGGSPDEDWARAEAELKSKAAR